MARAQEISIRFSCSCSWLSESWGTSTRSPSPMGTTFCILRRHRHTDMVGGQDVQLACGGHVQALVPSKAVPRDEWDLAKRLLGPTMLYNELEGSSARSGLPWRGEVTEAAHQCVWMEHVRELTVLWAPTGSSWPHRRARPRSLP